MSIKDKEKKIEINKKIEIRSVINFEVELTARTTFIKPPKFKKNAHKDFH